MNSEQCFRDLNTRSISTSKNTSHYSSLVCNRVKTCFSEEISRRAKTFRSIRISRNSFLLNLLVFFCLLKYTSGTECSFMDGKCTYNIRLAPPQSITDGSSGGGDQCKRYPPANFRQFSGTEESQNDYAEKMTHIVKDFDVIKDDHESRIRELENYIRKSLSRGGEPDVLKVATNIKSKIKQGSSESGGYGENGIPFDTTEGNLIKRLHDQFAAIRKLNRDKSQSLRVMNYKLNETRQKLADTQNNLLLTRDQLLQNEEALSRLQDDKYILQNQLKDRSERLDRAEKRADALEKKNKETDEKLLTLIRSENILKEEMYTAQYKLNETSQLLADARNQYRQLDVDFVRLISEISRREKELKLCYKAKTQTFCGFEDESICGFEQDNGTDFFDWSRSKGATPSTGTGPENDHTCESPNGHFMFIEASAKGRGHRAILKSPIYRAFNEQCVQFFYHMYGNHIGTLNVFTQTKMETDPRAVWRAYGNQGNVWIKARLSIPINLAKTGYQIVFEGSTETGYQGDIAIDDINIHDGPCPIDAQIKPVAVPDIDIVSLANNQTALKSIKKRRRKLLRHFRRRNGTRHGE
ncbi:uncharacterized protein LOC115231256 [Octopus sinensis]|uniref:Uncharacterized protein LOC115231256 n=1 Tax=Octopus sinensis TaxID=2607531 RepID=A0A6P7TXM6_9MOLL|nr:uncharacterized protein LOC115231256 [Octopus sinensis]